MAQRLTEQQRRRGRATLARKRGVSEAGLTDFDVEDAVSSGTLSIDECGGSYTPADTANYSYNSPSDPSPSYSSGSSSYDSGSSSSSYSSSSDSGSSGGGGGGGCD